MSQQGDLTTPTLSEYIRAFSPYPKRIGGENDFIRYLAEASTQKQRYLGGRWQIQEFPGEVVAGVIECTPPKLPSLACRNP